MMLPTRHILLALMFIAVVLPAAQEKSSGQREKQLTADELKELLATKDILFLDVRTPQELAEIGTIKGYVNIPVDQLDRRMSELPKDRLIVTACQRGVRASRAAATLRKNGYKVVGSCGLIEWKAKGYPLVYPKN